METFDNMSCEGPMLNTYGEGLRLNDMESVSPALADAVIELFLTFSGKLFMTQKACIRSIGCPIQLEPIGGAGKFNFCCAACCNSPSRHNPLSVA